MLADTSTNAVSFVIGNRDLADALSNSLEALCLPACEFELTADLATHMQRQATLRQMEEGDEPFEAGLRIIVLDSQDLSLLALNGCKPELSLLCGHSNQQALDGFASGVSRFYQLNAPVGIRQQQINHLMDDYFARLNALKWHSIMKRLSWQRACSPARLIRELAALQQRSSIPHSQISLRSGCGWHCLDWQLIRYVEAAGDYMCVYTQEETLVVRSTLTELAERLPEKYFLRVNRSVIINLHHVKQLNTLSPAVSYVELQDGSRLKISRRLLPQCLPQLANKVQQV